MSENAISNAIEAALPDPVPGDEIHDLWLARNPPAPEVVELEEESALLPE